MTTKNTPNYSKHYETVELGSDAHAKWYYVSHQVDGAPRTRPKSAFITRICPSISAPRVEGWALFSNPRTAFQFPIKLGAHLILDTETHHNFAWKKTHVVNGEEREVIVHRKGATPAGAGVCAKPTAFPTKQVCACASNPLRPERCPRVR